MGSQRLYENVVIGNFLYGLGFAIGARHGNEVMASAVSLLQQSPADKLLGDVLLESPGVVRLIEFKTESNRSGKEPARRRKLEASMARRDDLKEASRAIHWYVETAPSDKGVDARIVPYLDAFPGAPLSKRKEDRLETFIDQTAREIASGISKVSHETAKEYLTWVRRTLGEGEVGTGGLLLVADKDGVLRYAQLLDLQELRLQDRQWMLDRARRFDRELAQQRELNMKKDREQERSGKTQSLEIER